MAGRGSEQEHVGVGAPSAQPVCGAKARRGEHFSLGGRGGARQDGRPSAPAVCVCLRQARACGEGGKQAQVNSLPPWPVSSVNAGSCGLQCVLMYF